MYDSMRKGKNRQKHSRQADPLASIREVTRSVSQKLAVIAVFVFLNGFSSRLYVHMYNPVYLQGEFETGNTKRKLTAD